MTSQEKMALQDEYLERKKASTKKEWEAQMARFSGKINVESLWREGVKEGWTR